MEKTIEIPFGAKDSELKGWEYTIPEGMEAEIKDGKIIVKQKESEDEKIRKWLIEMVEELRKANPTSAEHNGNCSEAIAYLERQKEQKPESCDCSRDEESYTNGIHHVLMNPEAYGLIKQKPLSTEETKLNSITFLEQMGYTCIPPRKEQKPASGNSEKPNNHAEWSEEDDALLKEIVSFFRDGTVKLQHDLDLYAGFLEKKFKSLRPQPHWKPSEVQMKEYSYWYKNFIESGLASPSSKAVNVLGELLEQLKKL